MSTQIVKNISSERICFTDGCTAIGQNTGKKRKDGSISRRKYCSACHSKRTAAKHGLTNMQQVIAKNAGFDSVSKYLDQLANEKGFNNHTAYKNSTHPSLKYRKDYCENVDGRLGHTCTTTIVWEGQLDVDHKNGDPYDNRPKNLQTLCKCCHSYKTWISGDAQTAGRKTLKAA